VVHRSASGIIERVPTELDYFQALLDRLERYGQERRAPWARSLRPGLASAQIAAAMEATGLRLPPEAELLFSWHDGVDPNASPHARRILPPFEFFPLEERVQWYLKEWLPRINTIADSAELGRDEYWPPHWFPILDTGDRFNAAAVMVSCRPAGAADDQSDRHMLGSRPVLLSGIEGAGDAPRQVSLISLFETWLAWIHDDSVRWDDQAWVVNEAARHRHSWAMCFG
jgi:cell wall assembly regulator SMI1